MFITIVSIYIIYSFINVNKVNYVSISDNVINIDNYVSEYLYKKNKLSNFNNYFANQTIYNSYQDIVKNRTIRINDNDYYLKKVLRESDVLVLSIGMNELATNYNKYSMKSNYDFFNKMYVNIKMLINEIKKYAYGKVVFIGYFNPSNYYDANVDRFFYDINIKLSQLMIDNKIIYIDIYEVIKGNRYKDKNSFSLNNDGNKRIANSIEYYLA